MTSDLETLFQLWLTIKRASGVLGFRKDRSTVYIDLKFIVLIRQSRSDCNMHANKLCSVLFILSLAEHVLVLGACV